MSVQIENTCFEAAKEMTQRGKSSCVIMQMDPNTLRVTLDKQLPLGTTHDEISQTLHAIPECRYVIFHFAYKTHDNQERTKSIYLLWAPSVAPLKQRTVYAAFNSHVRAKLEGVSFEIQAGDVSELVHEDIADKCNRKFR